MSELLPFSFHEAGGQNFFPDRESNTGHGGESAGSYPLDHLGLHTENDTWEV